MPDHIEPNLDAYLAGGLSADERRDLEQHCAACPACALQLMEGKQVDQLMDNLFVRTRPDAGLEDRALERLHRQPARKRYGIMYFVLSAAAVIGLGLIGAAAQAMVEGGRFGGLRMAQAVRGERTDQAFVHDVSGSMEGRPPKSDELLKEIGAGVDSRHKGFSADSGKAFDADISYMNERISEVAVPGSVSLKDKEGEGIDFYPPALAIVEGKRKRIEAAANLDGIASGLTSNGTAGKANELASKRIYPVGDLMVPKDSANKPPLGSYYGGANMTYGKPATGPSGRNVNDVHAGIRAEDIAEKRPVANGGDGYFLPAPGKSEKEQLFSFGVGIYRDGVSKTPPPADVAKSNKQIKEAGEDQKKAEEIIKALEKQPAKVDQQPEPQPMPDLNRKIIRTGEMEFEIDSFYASVDTINGLLKKVTKGTGFVATSNSDKLPNGKMKGAVVVRMPPQHLDEFLAELRTALGKVGELKSQRIGSADVTKQYTDVESELRAARVVETRLIEIIKTGKGEIKDLIAAERELGTWRTKIEKMEGEIRYYNNQVALSTVTITLIEKEIQAAVSLVMRERVLMNIEVEEVEKAQESIAAGVKAAKGRLVKNDLAVGDAGQISAIVHVEVPPESAPLFRELLKKLGTLSKYQADRTQQAVGGVDKLTELKTKTDDVRFELNLYNSANIKPRETLHYKLGVTDVADTYRTIRETVTKLKGQIRKSDLNEKDPMNITADLVFNVAAPDRATIDKLIAAAGLIVSKQTVQAAINETATERTVGYELTLRNIAAIPPRDIFTVAVASQDVPASYRKLHEAVEQMKGRIHKGQVNEQDKFNVSAELDFDIATAEKPAIDKLISEVGVTISRKNEQFPGKDESTDQKVGYRLTLRNIAGSTPREKAMLALRVNDVDARAQHLKELVAASKGRVMFSKSERNKNGETKMVLIFELPHAALDTIIRQIKDGQTPLVYDKELNPQVPDNELATAQIALTLIAVPEIVPSDEDGLSAMLRTGLSKAVYVFLWCLVALISGLAFIVPWLIPIWIVVWLVRRNRTAKVVAVEAPKVG
jgi:hypothetical protein